MVDDLSPETKSYPIRLVVSGPSLLGAMESLRDLGLSELKVVEQQGLQVVDFFLAGLSFFSALNTSIACIEDVVPGAQVLRWQSVGQDYVTYLVPEYLGIHPKMEIFRKFELVPYKISVLGQIYIKCSFPSLSNALRAISLPSDFTSHFPEVNSAVIRWQPTLRRWVQQQYDMVDGYLAERT